MGESAHHESCVCHSCTCGRHKQLCKPVPHVETHLESETEYRVHYLPRNAGPRQMGKPHAQQLKVGGEFYSVTENREQFVAHDIPKVYQHPKEQYHPTPAKLDDITTTKSDYPAWPDVKPPQKRAQAKYTSTNGTFDGTTTTKTDYQNPGAQPRYVHPPAVYVKNEAKFEGNSSTKTDYLNWGDYRKPPPKAKAQFVSPPDDRDFKTTATANYVSHDFQRTLVKPEPHRIPRDTKFDGNTTTSTDYQTWPLPPREARKKVEYVPTAGQLESRSVYKESFEAKIAERVQSMAPKYQPMVTGKFEGFSTHHSDFQGYGDVPRREDFKPRLKYDPKRDDRDFLTVMKKDHDSKPIPRCQAADLLTGPLENKDGHLYARS